MIDVENQYKTSDLYFSAFLCCLDIPLTRTDREGEIGSKMVFVFDITPSVLAQAKRLYFGGTGTVNAAKYVDSLRRLKSLCYS